MSPCMVKPATAYFSHWEGTQLTGLHPQNSASEWYSPPNSTRFTAEKVLTSVRQHLPGSPNVFYCWRPCSLSNRCVNSRYFSRHKPLKHSCGISTVLLTPSSKTCEDNTSNILLVFVSNALCRVALPTLKPGGKGLGMLLLAPAGR